jgi:phage terminase small subunit
MAMTARQIRFCDEYLIDLNATQAAIRAGYSEKYANTNASKLLQITTIKDYIQKRKTDREKRTEITQDRVLHELALIAFSNAADYATVVEHDAMIDGQIMYDNEGKPIKYRTVEPVLTEELTEDQKRVLSVIKKGRDGFEVKPYDKLRALEMLGRHLGMWDKKSAADVEEQRARIEKLKADTMRIKGEDPNGEEQNDGFIDALRSEVQSVWEE